MRSSLVLNAAILYDHYLLLNYYYIFGVNSISLESNLLSPLNHNTNAHNGKKNNTENKKRRKKIPNNRTIDIDADACVKCAIVLKTEMVYVRIKHVI